MIISWLKPKVLLCGPTLIQDKTLQGLLRRKFRPLLLTTNKDLEKTIERKKIRLLVLEFSTEWQKEMEIFQKLVAQYTSLPIIVIDGNSSEKAIMTAFRYGAIDVFRKPYFKELLAERIEVLLLQSGNDGATARD